MSKNEVVFTPSIIGVNEKSTTLSGCIFSALQAVHKRVTEFGAAARAMIPAGLAKYAFWPHFYWLK
jgi:hypothetical protein